jgi:putative transposase
LDQHGAVSDVLVQSRRDRHAARRLMRKLLRKHGRAPRVLITDMLKSYAVANRDLGLKVEHGQHKGLNNQPTRVREKVMRRSKSAGHVQRFASVHDQVGNLFLHCRYHTDAKQKLALRAETFIRGVGKRDGRSDAGASRRSN